MGAQYVDQLQFQLNRRLNIIAHAHRLALGEEHSHLALFVWLAVGRTSDRYQV